MKSIAVHFHHDSTVALCIDGCYSAIELERVFGIRHFDVHREGIKVESLRNLPMLDCGTKFDRGILIGGPDRMAESFLKMLQVREIASVDHHAAHAACAFYQSPFTESLILSYDGGGNDGTFRTYIGNRGRGVVPIGSRCDLNLGIPYRALAYPIRTIRKPDDGRELSNAGKIMGLTAYGRVRQEWVEPLRKYFISVGSNGKFGEERYNWVVSKLQQISGALGLDLGRNALDGSDAFDLARTGQHVFEDLVLENFLPLVERYHLPLCITGGCALNVLTNQRIYEITGRSVFVPPNPNDCGLAVGGLLSFEKPVDQVLLAYCGVPILDADAIGGYIDKYGARQINVEDLAGILSAGSVVAIMRGNSEHGPRALGNRSIICDPSVAGMKKRLNQKVKFREDYRPYAPMVIEENLKAIFEQPSDHCTFMSFNPIFKQEWCNVFPSVTHVDFSARVQCVRETDNGWLYGLLREFERISGKPMLMNTSFNTKGMPIVTRIAEALDILRETDIDYLVIEDWLFDKESVARCT